MMKKQNATHVSLHPVHRVSTRVEHCGINHRTWNQVTNSTHLREQNETVITKVKLLPHACSGGETYTSDLTCGNTVFHVELVHDGWIKVAHQNFQRLISILVLPVLWHIQSKQVPVGEMQGGIKDFQTWRMHGAATYERRPWTSLQFKLKAFHLPHELAFCCHRLPTFTDKCWTPETTNI